MGIEDLIEDISLSSICFLGFSSRSVLTAPASDNLHSSSDGKQTRQNFCCESSRGCGIKQHSLTLIANLANVWKAALTVNFEVHATKDQRADELSLHLSLQIDKDGGQVPVRVIWDAGGGDGLEELGLRELSCQLTHVLVDEGT